ncbi:MAG: RNA polymerase sigma factor [Pirellulales bacterium]
MRRNGKSAATNGNSASNVQIHTNDHLATNGGMHANGKIHTNGNGAVLDRKLVDQCLTGDEAAWEQVFRQCQPPLLTSIRGLLGRDSGRMDLVEEIAARVWCSLLDGGTDLMDRYDVGRGCRLTTFLASLAQNEILRYLRSEHRRRFREFSANRITDRGEGVPHLQTETTLGEFLSTLSPREREFCERFLLAAPEESDASGYSTSNIWQLRHRVRSKLREYFQDE